MEKKHNFVYLTTNLLNGKQYVGSHATDNIQDNYLGSGRVFKKALKKNGRENFNREILQECQTILEARKLEAPMIVQYNTMHPNGYNVHDNGGWGYPESSHGPIAREKIRIGNTGKKHTQKTKDKLSIFRSKQTGEKASFFGHNHTEKSIKKISENRKGVTAGKNHHYFGKKRKEEVKKKISNKLTNRTFTEEHKDHLRQASEKVKKVICDHCGKEFAPWGIVRHKRSINKDI